ncbi:type II toxin-antitoxin system ParD family antitoxin [Sphingomonas glacialis]|uniref:Type II toxin-antitoxin system ParD family antitoxin n=1 Tax=Sphingomonas glacialis TaxID=658225 RepID=A0A502G509_9SPHN|nr:type II toxin-antitoxin system ParD family antitoxin [Sphingomonas glacialis]TPG56286.1 type II toxin-antitoxin system ParD family antitoxin [Sphingomonas glacialis]
MDVPVGPHWESFVEASVAEGRYASAVDVVNEGLRLVEERDAKIKALRETLQASIAEDVWYSADDVFLSVQEDLDAWERERG